MSASFISRLLGMIVMAAGAGWAGSVVARPLGGSELVYTMVFGLAGALMGLIITPYITVLPLRRLQRWVQRVPIHRIIAVLFGLVAGLVVGALAALPLSMLPNPFGQVLPVVSAALMGYLAVAVMTLRQADVVHFLRNRNGTGWSTNTDGRIGASRGILMDTSVIIDGRIGDIVQTGFLAGPLLVPGFVLNELQHIADSGEVLRRNRGRRGLELLNRLQKDATVPVQITDMDVDGAFGVDEKLVILAKQNRCPVLTNDYNLNKVAELQGVTVLNVNELAHAVRAVFLPGEELAIRIIQEGKERGQGVGYLEDGTMVVVDDGDRFIDQTVATVVTKVLQTAAGRMVFARRVDEP
jgi:uncharacterized protein YacL